jgi:hypothetical protein
MSPTALNHALLGIRGRKEFRTTKRRILSSGVSIGHLGCCRRPTVESFQSAKEFIDVRMRWSSEPQAIHKGTAVTGATLGIARTAFPRGRCIGANDRINLSPLNLHHPTYWMARAYGLLAANPFGLRAFTWDKNQEGNWTIPEGQSVKFR